MTNDEKIAEINKFQNDYHVHPLTCGIGTGSHDNLKPEIRNGEVVLVCPTCGWVQVGIPDFVFAVPNGMRGKFNVFGEDGELVF